MYPYYGEECMAECNCSELLCNATTGCKAVDEGMIQIFTN